MSVFYCFIFQASIATSIKSSGKIKTFNIIKFQIISDHFQLMNLIEDFQLINLIEEDQESRGRRLTQQVVQLRLESKSAQLLSSL